MSMENIAGKNVDGKHSRQESSRGHKFSILGKFSAHPGLHFCNALAIFEVALVGGKALHLAGAKTGLPLKRPTGAFVATQPRSCWGVPAPNPA